MSFGVLLRKRKCGVKSIELGKTSDERKERKRVRYRTRIYEIQGSESNDGYNNDNAERGDRRVNSNNKHVYHLTDLKVNEKAV